MHSNRREFTVLAAATIGAPIVGPARAEALGTEPWHRRVRRYGQVNITEDDGNMDIGFWRRYWKDTHIGAVLLNAGGIVAYYPSNIPHHRRARSLGARDLFGELTQACKVDGIEIIARMTNDVTSELVAAHPEWMSQDAHGNRQRRACMNGQFMRDYIASIIEEIVSRYRPAGFAVNGGGGLNYDLCYCQVCSPLFKNDTGLDLPREKDWNDLAYREWVSWNAKKAADLWDMFNKVSQGAGGADCYWIGVLGTTLASSLTFRNLRLLSERVPLIMYDHQWRLDSTGMQQNSETGKLLHSLVGWNNIVTEAQALYGPRLSSRPAADVQMWMYEGMAGGLTPWWHTVSAHHHDKRRYSTPLEVFDWHRQNEQYLYDRSPVATVGVVWSEENNVFYGRDDIGGNVEGPWRGIINALVSARIPYKVIYVDRIDQDAVGLSALILPNLAAMSDRQVASVKRFVSNGGGLFATGDTSLHDEFGAVRQDYALADLFGAHWIPGTEPNTGYALPDQKLSSSMVGISNGIGPIVPPGMEFIFREATTDPEWSPPNLPHSQQKRPLNLNTYLRLSPELRANVAYSPHPHGDEPQPPPQARRHPIFKDLDQTDVVGYGGILPHLNVDPTAQVLATFVPEVPYSQPEMVFWRTPKTEIPGLVVNSMPNGARIVFMPADIDRQYACSNLPDHADIIANAIRWTLKNNIPLEVETDALVDCHLYQQTGRMILHILNLTNAATWKGPLKKFVSIGPVRVRVKLNSDVQGGSVNLLVASLPISTTRANGWIEFTIPHLLHHEVALIS
jgi:hypothetical protein